MTHTLRIALAAFLGCLFVAISHGQALPGIPQFNSFGGGPDVINLGNLNAHWDIPIINKAGRGQNFTWDLTYDSSIWYPVVSGTSQVWAPVAGYGWGGLLQTAGTYIGYNVTTSEGNCGQHGQYQWQSWTYTNFTYRDLYGNMYTLEGSVTYINSPGSADECPASGTSPSLPFTFPSAGSGFSAVVSSAGENTISMTLISAAGKSIVVPVVTNPPASQGAYSITDRNGNIISYNGTGAFTDTLGTTALSIAGSAPSNTLLSFTNSSGGDSSYTVSYTEKNIKTNFGCSGISEYTANNVYLVSEIELPDGRSYQFTYEATPSHSGYVTGRIASVTLPTGGEITYSYTGSNNGIECADGSAAGLTRTTPDAPTSPWQYARTGSGTQWTTTITAPAYQTVQNQTVIAFLTDTSATTFSNFYEIARKIYSGSATSGTLLQTILTCYNSSSDCSSTIGDNQPNVTDPITWRQQTIQMGGSAARAYGNSESYNGYGLVTGHIDYNFGSSGSFGSALRQIITAYAALANGVNNMPSQVTIEDGAGSVYSETKYSYDAAGSITATSGTPQHTSGTNAGNLTSLVQCISSACSGSSALTSSYTYFDTGNVNVATDVNGTPATYSYGACGNSFPTEVSVDGLTVQETWNCTGGVQVTSVDPNSNTTTYTYGDANYWRVTKTTDPFGNATTQSYPTTSGNTSESALQFNPQGTSGLSATDILTQYDSQGRVQLNQTRQAPGSSTFDITAVAYDTLGRLSEASIPYSGSAGTSDPTPGKATIYNALGWITSVNDSFSGGGTTTYGWDPLNEGNQNDVLVTVGPAPSGENTKQRQLEYDAVGRLSSVCEVTTLTGSGACAGIGGQESTAAGYLTEYTYDPANRLTEVQQNAQSSGSTQTRTVSYDWLGRKTSETNPETGTITYTYDSDPTCGTSKGDLVKRVDAFATNPNNICITYDGLHRPTSVKVASGTYSSVTQQTYYVYDAGTLSGTAMQNVKGQLAEAYTCTGTCTLTSGHATDIFFSYFPESGSTGRIVAQTYEMTPHSGGSYYLTQDAYYPNGTVGAVTASLNGSSIGVPSVAFGLDGEGRLNTASDGTHTLVQATGTSYNSASYPTAIAFGNGDADSYQYNSNTYLPTKFLYTVTGSGAFTITGNLTWNPNWSLEEMTLADTNDSSKNQTCNYSADDLQRLASVNCSSAWEQTFTYTPFGNISKTASPGPGTQYLPAYSSLTNRVTTASMATYDANGNQTKNTWATFAWNAVANPVTVNGIGATYDALDRMVETANGTTYTDYIYRPSGDKLAIYNPTTSTLLQSGISLPGGATAIYNSSGLAYLRHKDWLGSSRLATTWAHAVYSKEAYAPFGEPYNEAGTTDRSFTGQDQNTTSGIYDYMFRRYDPTAGRWLSPDPAGWAVVDQNNPQSFNRYAYVMNDPLSFVDLLGLDCTAYPGGTWMTSSESEGADVPPPNSGPNEYPNVVCTPDSVPNNSYIPEESLLNSGMTGPLTSQQQLQRTCDAIYQSYVSQVAQQKLKNSAQNVIAWGVGFVGGAPGGLGVATLTGTLAGLQSLAFERMNNWNMDAITTNAKLQLYLAGCDNGGWDTSQP
jgi:RHS repeat-associated protein